MPSDDPRTRTTLGYARELRTRPDLHRVLPSITPRIGIGAPVWAVKEWVGKVYPPKTPSKDFLTHYSRQFNSIEMNSTHYGTPSRETVNRWINETPETFRFNIKFLQTISHAYALDENAALTREFVDAILPLGERLGICFLQLPPGFEPSSLVRLSRFLSSLPSELKVAVEVRHPAFFNQHRLLDDYFNVLQDRGAHAVITDVSGRRDVLHTSLPSSRVIVRFIGNAVDDIDNPRLDHWITRLNTWLKLGLEQVEFFIHEPDNMAAPDAIHGFIERFNASSSQNVANWSPSTPKQMGFF